MARKNKDKYQSTGKSRNTGALAFWDCIVQAEGWGSEAEISCTKKRVRFSSNELYSFRTLMA